MRSSLVAFVSLLLLAGCGHEDEIAARKADLSKTVAQREALERELAEKLKDWEPTKEAFIAASQTLKRVLLAGDDASKEAAQAAYDQAQKKNQRVQKLEWGLRGQISELKKKEKELRAAIRRLGG